jgi:hypothetical protein
MRFALVTTPKLELWLGLLVAGNHSTLSSRRDNIKKETNSSGSGLGVSGRLGLSDVQ